MPGARKSGMRHRPGPQSARARSGFDGVVVQRQQRSRFIARLLPVRALQRGGASFAASCAMGISPSICARLHAMGRRQPSLRYADHRRFRSTGSSRGLLELPRRSSARKIRHRDTGQLGGSAASGYTHRTGGTGVARDRSVAAAVARISKRRRQIRPLVLLAFYRLHRRRGARFDPALRDQLAPAINHESDAHLGLGRTDPADDGRAARLPGRSQPLLLRLRQIPRGLLVAAAASGARARRCLLDASCPAPIRRSSAHANPPAMESLPARAAAAGNRASVGSAERECSRGCC